MTKRQYIDLVRQYATMARRNNRSYAEVIYGLHDQYMTAVLDRGAGAAEQEKEETWSMSFLAREYSPYDRDYKITEMS